MKPDLRLRRFLTVLALVFGISAVLLANPNLYQPVTIPTPEVVAQTPDLAPASPSEGSALQALETLPVKGRAPKTDYSRSQFGNGWRTVAGCDTRNIILNRDMQNVVTNDKCQVMSGTLHDPYTGTIIAFTRGESTSQAVQIDHVVALSNAWQTGAQQLSSAVREDLANDPLELLAVEGKANQQKSDGDAATWLPSNKVFRCQYVARQIAVKAKYGLWVTAPEKDAILRILEACPDQKTTTEASQPTGVTVH